MMILALKCSMHSTWWVICVVLLLTKSVSTQDVLDYECSTTGIISVTNPDPSIYIWAQVNASTYICNSSLISDKIFIYDCFNESLTMLLSNEIGLPVIITSIIKSYRLSCSEIPPEGITRRVVDETHMIHEVSTAIPPTVLPEITINTTLVDTETGEMRVIAYTGEHFWWYIWGPAGYIIEPEYCTAYSEELPDTTRYSVDTHIDACTLDEALISDFGHANASLNLVVADVYAFRFPNGDQLHLFCSVRGCPLTSSNCDFNCTTSRKRREEAEDLTAEDMVSRKIRPSTEKFVSTTEMPTSAPSAKHKKDVMRHGKVFASLKVVGKPNIVIDEHLIGEASILYSYSVSWSTTVLLALSLILSQ